jgi:hypothetical protein
MEHIFENGTLSFDIPSLKLIQVVVQIIALDYIVSLGTSGVDQ